MVRARQPRPTPVFLAAPATLCLVGAAACGPQVDCDNLCERTLTCEVSFAPSDDVGGDRLKSGERTDLESCSLGCAENPAVTVEAARCVDDVTDRTTDPKQCQAPILACFGTGVTAD